MCTLPKSFLTQMKEQLGEEFPAFLDSYRQKSVRGIRLHSGKWQYSVLPSQVKEQLTKVPWTANGYYYQPDAWTPSKDPGYFAGLYYIQEPSAMISASILPVSPGERVLDLCAAPGGKATELGVKLGGDGLLVANDLSVSRAKSLLGNLERFAIEPIMVTAEQPERLVPHFCGFFDKILVDAPCSGEGMFRRDPSAVAAYRERGPKYYQPIQREILKSAVAMLRGGGQLVYSTCTFSKEENEENIEWLLDQYPELSVVRPIWKQEFSHGLTERTRDCVRLWPYRIKGEGHFAALLTKRAAPGEAYRDEAPPESAPLPDLWGRQQTLPEFFDMVHREFAMNRIVQIRDQLFYLPDGLPACRGLRVLRRGLLLGRLDRGSRFLPSQALAMTLAPDTFEQVILLDRQDERVYKYLRGETLMLEQENMSGWVLVCVDGHPLGFGKAGNGMLKNKICREWRLQ